MPKQQHPYPRTDRLDELFREILSEEIGALSDPRLDRVTVTDVAVSPDLRHADVFVVGASGADEEALLDALGHAAGHLRTQIGRQVRVKRSPELRFRIDQSIATAERIDAILSNLPTPASAPGDGPPDAQGVLGIGEPVSPEAPAPRAIPRSEEGVRGIGEPGAGSVRGVSERSPDAQGF